MYHEQDADDSRGFITTRDSGAWGCIWAAAGGSSSSSMSSAPPAPEPPPEASSGVGHAQNLCQQTGGLNSAAEPGGMTEDGSSRPIPRIKVNNTLCV